MIDKLRRMGVDELYSSLRVVNKKPNKEHDINGKKYIPVYVSGAWKHFIDVEKQSLSVQNKGTSSIQTKSYHPILKEIDTIFIGDSFARLMEPPPPWMYVIGYPGIPLRSLDRSFDGDIKEDTKITSKNRPLWIHPQMLSPERKSKKIYLSVASTTSSNKPIKQMFFEFSSKSLRGPDLYSYPRTDIIRQIVRFPMKKIRNIVFWIGNAEMQISFYHKLFQVFPAPSTISVAFRTEYQSFVEGYIDECVSSYVQYLKYIHRLVPGVRLYVILLNYSPVKCRSFKAILLGMRGFTASSMSSSQFTQYVFNDERRQKMVDMFNHKLSSDAFIRKNVNLVNINPIIFDSTKRSLHPRFILNPYDIHIDDPKREVYRAIVSILLSK